MKSRERIIETLTNVIFGKKSLINAVNHASVMDATLASDLLSIRNSMEPIIESTNQTFDEFRRINRYIELQCSHFSQIVEPVKSRMAELSNLWRDLSQQYNTHIEDNIEGNTTFDWPWHEYSCPLWEESEVDSEMEIKTKEIHEFLMGKTNALDTQAPSILEHSETLKIRRPCYSVRQNMVIK